ncbi:MAG: hypothetical protein HYV04_09730 [Deltaproteobacteria bacterium]|nr:hypothetical protein [Deltaproteobacteria bacterium]
MRTGEGLADFSAAQEISLAIVINVSRTNNEKAACLIFVIVVTSDIFALPSLKEWKIIDLLFR